MALLATYRMPGLIVEERAVEVPLDWRGTSPSRLAGQGSARSKLAATTEVEQPDAAFVGRTLKQFCRVLTAPQNEGKDLPLLVYFQGGPGCACARPTSGTGGWLGEALKHFRVVLPDQRGTGRSSRVDGTSIVDEGDDTARARFLQRLLADSIVRDFEYLRLTEFEGKRWVSLGQSYGGFITLAYLSAFPEGLAGCMVCGGIPHVPASAQEVYAHTMPRMIARSRRLYERYPQDEKRVALLADYAAAVGPRLADDSMLTPERLQAFGQGLGMGPGVERLHNVFDLAFAAGSGTAEEALAAAGGNLEQLRLTSAFVDEALALTGSAARPLYWTLQEFIYADGELERPIGWAAAAERARYAELAPEARPLLFLGEAALPWMFEQDPALKPFAGAVDMLMVETHFGALYDREQLAASEVLLEAAVYFEDLYVDSSLQLDTLSRMGASHAWVTNEFEHDGIASPGVFERLRDGLIDRGARIL